MRKTPRGWIQIGESRTRGVARIPLGLKPSRDSRATSQRDSPIWIQPLGVFRYKKEVTPVLMPWSYNFLALTHRHNHKRVNHNKMFWEWQHLLLAEIRKCEHSLSVAISYRDLLHGKLHHATKCQAVMWFPQFHLPGPSLSWKISKFRGMPQNWSSIAIFGSDRLHCTVHHLTKFQANSWNP